MQHIH